MKTSKTSTAAPVVIAWLFCFLATPQQQTWAQFIACELCGEGREMTNLEGVVSIPGNGDFSCLQLQQLGLSGGVDSATCTGLGPFVDVPCGCRASLGDNETATPTQSAAPTLSPTFAPTFKPAPSDCYSDLDNIAAREKALSDTELQIVREYILCPDTAYFIAREIGATGLFENVYQPFFPRPNVHYRCGKDGSSANNCRILDGVYAIISLAQFTTDAIVSNVTFQGLTIESTAVGGVFAGLPGTFDFVDCIFKNHQIQTAVVTMVFQNRQRRMLLEEDGAPDEPVTPLQSQEVERDLEAESSSLTFSFRHCIFEGNVFAPSATGGPSARGIVNAQSPDNHLVFEDTIFLDNDDGNDRNQSTSSAIRSSGPLKITNTCFENNFFIGATPVLSFSRSSDLIDVSNNFVDVDEDDSVECPFVAHFADGPNTNLTSCMIADAESCQSQQAPTFVSQPTTPVMPPTRAPVPRITLAPVLPPTTQPSSAPSFQWNIRTSLGWILPVIIGTLLGNAC